MCHWLLMLLLLLPVNASSQTIRFLDEGTELGAIANIDCVGSGVVCTRTVTPAGRQIGTLTIAGGGGAPTGAFYWTGAADGTLTNEINLGALGTGLVINTAGTPSIYGGVTCTNQVLTALTASGAGTCTTITSAYTSGTFSPSAHDLLSASHSDTLAGSVARGDVMRGNSTPKWSRLALGGNNLYLKSNGTDLVYSTLAAAGVGSCTNQFVTAENADAAPTCTTATLASAQFANQGTTTTVLHGNAAGNPSFAKVDLTNDTTGSVTDAMVPNNITIDLATSATTASALAGNGTNCTTPDVALGVDASGNAECTTPAVSVLQYNGVSLPTQTAKLNFTGTNVFCTLSAADQTTCTIQPQNKLPVKPTLLQVATAKYQRRLQ